MTILVYFYSTKRYVLEEKIGLFYGSDTGCTEDITQDLVAIWKTDELIVKEINTASIEDFKQYDILILGLSTWYDGDLQSDWEDFFDDFQKIDFTSKKIALYGLGDQIGYGEYFVDGIGILAKVILQNGGEIIGHWPTEGYTFDESLAVIEDNPDYFYGLAIDDDNEHELNDERLRKWISQIKKELNYN